MESLTNRFNDINILLLKISNAISKNNIDSLFIHTLIIEKKETDISNLFSKWCDLFKFKKNIKVYQKNNKCFFENQKENILNNNCFKIFVPYDEKNIYKRAEEIFNFLAENNIAHLSTIEKYISNECITIKLNNIDDANKLNLFLKLNKKGLIKANPCCFCYNDLAFAIDRRIDYNILLSYLLYKYMELTNINNQLDLVNVNDFKKFSYNYYLDIFENGTALEKFINEMSIIEKTINNNGLEYSKLDQLVNYKDTMKLIIAAIDEKNDFMNYMNHYEKLNNENYNFNESMLINELLFNLTGKKELYFTIKDKERILQESIISTIKKYNMEQGHNALNTYITSGDAKLFTRDGNARNNMHYILTPKDCVSIIKSFFKDELNIDKYVDITMNINLSKIKRELLDRAIIETIKEKGIGHTKETLEKITREHNIMDLKKISKINDARKNLYKFINIKEIETLMKQTLTNFPGSIVQEKYIDLYLQRIKKNIEGI